MTYKTLTVIRTIEETGVRSAPLTYLHRMKEDMIQDLARKLVEDNLLDIDEEYDIKTQRRLFSLRVRVAERTGDNNAFL